MRVAEEPDDLGHGWLEWAAVFGVSHPVHGEGVAVGEEGGC